MTNWHGERTFHGPVLKGKPVKADKLQAEPGRPTGTAGAADFKTFLPGKEKEENRGDKRSETYEAPEYTQRINRGDTQVSFFSLFY